RKRHRQRGVGRPGKRRRPVEAGHYVSYWHGGVGGFHHPGLGTAKVLVGRLRPRRRGKGHLFCSAAPPRRPAAREERVRPGRAGRGGMKDAVSRGACGLAMSTILKPCADRRDGWDDDSDAPCPPKSASRRRPTTAPASTIC